MVPNDYVAHLYKAYTDHGILLSQAEISLIDSMSITKDDGIERMIAESSAQIERDWKIQLGTLEEAEEAKRVAEEARDREAKLNGELHKRNEQMQKLNEELQKRQKKTEEQLAQEQEWRARIDRTNFQKQFATYLMFLIGGILVLPYLGSIVSAPEKLIDTTGNLALLLIQTLGVVAGFLFNRRQDGEDGNGKRR